MVLRIFEQMSGGNEMLDVGPTYKLKFEDFFDRAINKGVELESQSNPLYLCTKPQAVIKLRKGA